VQQLMFGSINHLF